MNKLLFHSFLLVREPALRCGDFDAADCRAWLGRPATQTALRLASPGFYRRLEASSFDWDRLDARAQLTLLNYYNRMCYRPTPFGAFASFGPGRWDEGEGTNERLLHLSPDWAALCAAVEDTGFYRLNPSLYRVGSEYRFIRSVPVGSKLSFTLESLTANRVLNSLYASSIKIISEAEIIGLADQEYLDFLLVSQWLVRAGTPLLVGPAGKATGEATCYAGLENPSPGGLPAAWQEPLRSALRAAAALTPADPLPALEEFKEAFSRRYDRQKVPLLLALDPELGIGYARLGGEAEQPLLAGIAFPAAAPARSVAWGKIQQLLLEKWARGGIQLEPADLKDFSGSSLRRPSLGVLFRQTPDGLWLEAAPPATALAARFTIWSKAVQAAVREIAREEERVNPGVIFAELLQLTDNHTDNINRRENLYSYELPINTSSGLPADRQLALADLLVSVRDDRILLESGRHKREVVPRLSSAFNYNRHELAVFRFLADLQEQGLDRVNVADPERFFPGLNFYPRLSFGQVVFSPAKWYLSKEQLAAPVSGLRQHLGWPAMVVLAEGDRELVFNLDAAAGRSHLAQALRGGARALIREYLPPPGDRNRQYLAFLSNAQPVYPAAKIFPVVRKSRRVYLPGSDWYYLQLYCSPGASDAILAGHILPLIRTLEKNGPLGWFFVRYRDDGYHIRLRLKTTSGHLAAVIRACEHRLAPLVRRGLLGRVVAADYEPEWERYGRKLPLVEEFFHAGSELTLVYLKKGQPAKMLPFILVREMVSKLRGERQTAFPEKMVRAFYREFNADAALRQSLGEKYRALQPELASLPPGLPASCRRFEQALDRLCPLNETLLADLIHMQLNRLFSDRQREQELLVYYCCWKLSLRACS